MQDEIEIKSHYDSKFKVSKSNITQDIIICLASSVGQVVSCSDAYNKIQKDVDRGRFDDTFFNRDVNETFCPRPDPRDRHLDPPKLRPFNFKTER